MKQQLKIKILSRHFKVQYSMEMKTIISISSMNTQT